MDFGSAKVRQERSVSMETLVHAQSSDGFIEYSSKLAKASLFLYLFFVFFGTSLPFQENIRSMEDFSTENPVNQIVYSSLFVLSCISLFPKRSLAIRFFKREKFLGLFLIWSLLTVSWSDLPFVSFKRWIQTFGMVIVFVSAFLHFQSEEEAFGYVRAVLIAYIPLSLLSILLVPGATHVKYDAWRGLASHKNMLGQVSLLSLIVWSCAVCNPDYDRKMLGLFYGGLSCVMLVGSRSATSIVTGVILLFLATVHYAEKKIARPVVGRTISSMLVLSCLIPVCFLIYLAPDIAPSLFGLIGKQWSVIVRADIWSSMWEVIEKHWILGCGFQGFWVADNPAILGIYEELQWMTPHAHQGYLEILNETGIIGLSLFLLMTIQYFHNASTHGKSHSGIWVVIAVLILNATESTLFRLHEVTGVLFVFSYLALYATHFRWDSSAPGSDSPSLPTSR
jgi:exopolysaccharide production protein ExoQ